MFKVLVILKVVPGKKKDWITRLAKNKESKHLSNICRMVTQVCSRPRDTCKKYISTAGVKQNICAKSKTEYFI